MFEIMRLLIITGIGGESDGALVRKHDFYGRRENVLTANVRLRNSNGNADTNNKSEIGFVQMVSDWALDRSVFETVDASRYGGIEFDVLYTAAVAHAMTMTVTLLQRTVTISKNLTCT